jgi:hypothetical protein
MATASKKQSSSSRRGKQPRQPRQAKTKTLRKLNQLTESSGALRTGSGLITGVIALSLAILCFLGVLAFHFPAYLTTPELRKSYDVQTLRHVMLAAMVIAGGLSLRNIIFNRSRWLSAAAFALVTLCALMGGHKIEVDPNFADAKYYIGLDWFILDLLGSTLIFIFIEKLFPLFYWRPTNWFTVDLAGLLTIPCRRGFKRCRSYSKYC